MLKSSRVKRRSIIIDGRRTNATLEDPFWQQLKEIAEKREQTLSEIVSKIDKDREHTNLSSATRLFVFGYVRDEIARYAKVAKRRTRR